MADFYLKKNDSKNKIEDSEQLCLSLCQSANEFFSASLYLRDKLDLFLVAISNCAFCCELYLKAILVGYGVDYKNKALIDDSHNLERLFNLLPIREREYISNHISLENKSEFNLLLHENGNAFIVVRYACERKDITVDYRFLFLFADILKYVIECLLKERHFEL